MFIARLKAAVGVLLFSMTASAAEPRVDALEIVTASGPHKFEVEVAQTQAEREKGLMFRRSMPRNRGMIFDFRTEKVVMMWMKNTYIPLDMIFVSSNGRVVSVAHDAKPMSEAIISSEAPAYAVIELNAGVAKEIGAAVGDSVRHAMFHP